MVGAGLNTGLGTPGAVTTGRGPKIGLSPNTGRGAASEACGIATIAATLAASTSALVVCRVIAVSLGSVAARCCNVMERAERPATIR
jgi:hypothetical protein